MRKALILDDIKDAVHVAKNRSLFVRDDIMIFSAHVSVDVFLKEKFQIECVSLCKFLTPAQVAQNIKLSDNMANEIVDLLDTAHSGKINEKAGLRGIRVFRALCSYPVYFQLISCFNLYDALKEAMEREKISEILFFDKRINEYYDFDITIWDALKVFPGVKLTPLINNSGKQTGLNQGVLRWQKFINYPSLSFANLFLKFENFMLKLRYSNITKGKKTIVVFEPLYDLSFLPRHTALSGFNILYHDFNSDFMADRSLPLAHDHKISGIPEGLKKADGVDYRSYFRDISIRNSEKLFNDNSEKYLRCLKTIDRLNNIYDIKLGIWGASPTSGPASLVFEYLIKNNKPVIGMQHGGLLGNLHNSDVCLTDMNRCSNYISYGFNKSDLKKTYPGKKIDNVTIHELGSMKINKKRSAKRPAIHLLFPMTNTISMLEGGMMRDMPDTILDNQAKLVKYLDGVAGHTIIVKPFPFSDHSCLAILPVLEKMKMVKVINNLSFENALNLYDIKAVLLEHATTTLYEALAYDAEIFLVNHNMVRPIEEGALGELKKRVHYAESADEIIPKLELFFKGKLEKKRDDTFYNHYVCREGTERKILGLIKSLAGS